MPIKDRAVRVWYILVDPMLCTLPLIFGCGLRVDIQVSVGVGEQAIILARIDDLRPKPGDAAGLAVLGCEFQP